MKTIIINNLEWQAKDDGIKRTWEDSIIYATTLGDGWRLPTIGELFSIIDFTVYKPACKIDSCRSSYYWSSSPHTNHSDYAWYVYFYDGDVSYRDKCYHDYVRCVRELHAIQQGITDEYYHNNAR